MDVDGYSQKDELVQKELHRMAQRKYFRANRHKVLAANREYYHKNKEKIREAKRAYYKKNPERMREYQRKYRLRLKEISA